MPDQITLMQEKLAEVRAASRCELTDEEGEVLHPNVFVVVDLETGNLDLSSEDKSEGGFSIPRAGLRSFLMFAEQLLKE